MASRLGQSGQDLQHFVSQSPWSTDLLLEGLAKATALNAPNYWIIDETSFPKAGSHSAGVQRQYCGALGKTANCQLAVSLNRANEAAGTSQPLGWRLFLPESWTDDPVRCQRAGVPPELVHRSKQDLALELLNQALGWKSLPGVVLADEAYGSGFEWRLALRERGLFYCVRVPWTTTAWLEEPRFGVPAPVRRSFRAKRGQGEKQGILVPAMFADVASVFAGFVEGMFAAAGSIGMALAGSGGEALRRYHAWKTKDPPRGGKGPEPTASPKGS